MSKLPQVRRLMVEDFIEQKDWIANLFTPLNIFMEQTYQVLNRGINLKDNIQGDIQTVTIGFIPTVAAPLTLAWSLPTKPQAIHVGQVTRKDKADFTLTAAVQVQWKYDSKVGLRLVNVVGITPTNASQYDLTLIIYAG